MRALPAALLLLMVACHARNPAFCPGGEDPSGECAMDAPPICYGAQPFAICVIPPDAPRVLARVNTDTDCDEVVTLGHELCVVKGTTIQVGQRVPISGSRPLVILGSEAITIDESGILDANGGMNAAGPGADLACGAGATMGATNLAGGGGGAGGTFGDRGGNGGGGGGGRGAGAIALMLAAPPMALQGGCSGTAGGDGLPGTGGGRGFGGGGLYLVAGQTLTVRGTITASGSGGRGGRHVKGAGGGGGSGGMIVLFAPTAVVMPGTQIFANGGGGGGGGNTSADGNDGSTATVPVPAAPGGKGQGGDGGDGAYRSTSAGAGMSSSDGGGGGGGGVGVIYVLGGNFDAANVSPSPS